jgi:hypothetical protein
MIDSCGIITWYVLETGGVEFWMRDTGPMSVEQLIEQLEALGEREPAGNSPS